MFERYSEKARRAIFFARYEASEFGSPYIEVEHMLLGILRETVLARALLPADAAEEFKRVIEREKGKREHISTSVDLPLSSASKRVLAYGAEEAERLKLTQIESEHLLLGIFREGDSIAADFLKRHGVSLQVLRERIASDPSQPANNRQRVEALRSVLAPLTRQLGPEIEPATVFFPQ